MDMNTFNQYFEDLDTKVSADLERDGVQKEDQIIRYFLDMKYGLQIHVVRIEIVRKKYAVNEADLIASQFDKAYEDLYGKGAAYSAAGRIITTFIVSGQAEPPKIILEKHVPQEADASKALKGQRKAFFSKYNGYISTNLYDYDKLQAGNIVEGPAIIEATDTTIVIQPDQKGYVDEYSNIQIKV
jgi:N-methylhydantoinase A/oxoprolinase/acetone carboxylase beta subunit